MLAFASCFSLLLAGSPDSSTYHKTYLNDQLDRKDAESIVYNLTQEVCGEVPHYMNSNCRNILPNADHSRVCAIETNHGYFFVTKDMLDGVNIIFNRWD